MSKKEKQQDEKSKKEKYYLLLFNSSLTIELEPAVVGNEFIYNALGEKCGSKTVVKKDAKTITINNSVRDYRQQLAFDMQAMEKHFSAGNAKARLVLPANQHELTKKEAKLIYETLVDYKQDTGIDFAMFQIVDISADDFKEPKKPKKLKEEKPKENAKEEKNEVEEVKAEEVKEVSK